MQKRAHVLEEKVWHRLYNVQWKKVGLFLEMQIKFLGISLSQNAAA